jgi:hypothetical protein
MNAVQHKNKRALNYIIGVYACINFLSVNALGSPYAFSSGSREALLLVLKISLSG